MKKQKSTFQNHIKTCKANRDEPPPVYQRRYLAETRAAYLGHS